MLVTIEAIPLPIPFKKVIHMAVEKQNKTEYDGSKPTRVLINKLASVSSVDKATDRIKTRFDVLLKERAEIQDQLNTVSDPEQRANLVDADESKAAELTKLHEAKEPLEAKRQELLDKRATEIQGYKPKEISWS
ncbi:hypothetical protein ACFL5D_05150 [Candidatus Neomarinimicrobiota bacterium]